MKKLYRKVKSILYDCYCPICIGYWDEWIENGFEFEILKKVNIIGGGKRKHLCPNCGSPDRVRMIYSYLHSKTDLFSPKNPVVLLHVAPERQLLDIFEKNNNIEYYPCDKFNYSNNVQKADITQLQFVENFFDFLICNHVLEHIEDDAKAMSELYRVMKPNGIGILQIPYSISIKTNIENNEIRLPEEREICFGQDDHVRIYAKSEYIKTLNSVGFKVSTINPYSANWDFNPKKLGLNKREDLFIVQK
jgi:SAM-dependent methyltransferase